MLLNGKTLCKYLGIEPDTLRRIRRDDPTFPGFFTRKLYSKPEIDNWLRRRLPVEQENTKFNIDVKVDNTLAEMFGDSSSPVEEASPPADAVKQSGIRLNLTQ